MPLLGYVFSLQRTVCSGRFAVCSGRFAVCKDKDSSGYAVAVCFVIVSANGELIQSQKDSNPANRLP